MDAAESARLIEAHTDLPRKAAAMIFPRVKQHVEFDELVSLGNAESDLGWYLFLQRFHTEGTGVPLPEGLLTRDEIIGIWEEQLGRKAVNVDFYEKLGGFHFTLVMMRIGAMTELLAGGNAAVYSVNNPVAQLTKQLIGF